MQTARNKTFWKSDIESNYRLDAEFVEVAKQRIEDLYAGKLKYRPLEKPVHKPTGREKVAQIPLEWMFPITSDAR